MNKRHGKVNQIQKTKNITRNWEIYANNTSILSFNSRLIMLGLLYFKLITLPLVSLYFIFDMSQYFLASIMYNIVARLQELSILNKNIRPWWINYPAKLFYVLKYLTLILALITLI